MNRIVDPAEVLLELGLSASATDEERAVVATALAGAEASVRSYLGYDPTLLERTELYPRQEVGAPSGVGMWDVSDTHAYLRWWGTASAGELQLQHIPLRSVASLYVDYDARSGSVAGAFAAGTLKTEGDDFWPNYDRVDSDGGSVCSDGILHNRGSWPTTPGEVKVTYTAGYSDAELHGEDSLIDARPIADAVVAEAVRRVRRMFALKKRTGAGFVAGALTGERMGDYSYTVDPTAAGQVATGALSAASRGMLEPFVNVGWFQ